MSKRTERKRRQDRKYLLLIIPIILIAVLLVYYLLHQQQNNLNSSENLENEIIPEALVNIQGTVYNQNEKANGEITIGLVKAQVKDGSYEIKAIAPGLYKTIFVGKDGQRRLLNPNTVRVYAGNSQLLDFTVINQP